MSLRSYNLVVDFYPGKAWYMDYSKKMESNYMFCPYANQMLCPKYCCQEAFLLKDFRESEYIKNKERLSGYAMQWQTKIIAEYYVEPLVSKSEVIRYSGLCPEVTFKMFSLFASDISVLSIRQFERLKNTAVILPTCILDEFTGRYIKVDKVGHFSECGIWSIQKVHNITINRIEPSNNVIPKHGLVVSEDNRFPATPDMPGNRIKFIDGYRRFKVWFEKDNSWEEYFFNKTQAIIFKIVYESEGRTIHVRRLFKELKKAGKLKCRTFVMRNYFKNFDTKWRKILINEKKGFWHTPFPPDNVSE